MPDPEPKPDPSGWAGILQLLITALGGAAKWAVIVAGILIALYFFIDQQRKFADASAKARQEAEQLQAQKLKDADARVAEAQKLLLETYTKFQEIGSKQVENLRSVLDLREVVDKATRAKIQETQQLEEGKRRAEQELSERKTESSRIGQELDKKKLQMQAQTDELLQKQKQLEKAQLDFETERNGRLRNAEIYNSIKDKLIRLAEEVQNADRQIDDSTKSLAKEILAEAQDINLLFENFFRNPNLATFEAIKPIIGMSRDNILKINFDEIGFATLLCFDSGRGSESACAVLRSQDESAYEDVLAIVFEKDVVIDVKYASRLFAVKIHSTDNWNNEALGVRYMSPNQAEAYFDVTGLSGSSWTLEDLMRVDSGGSKIRVKFDRRSGPVKSLTPEEYEHLFPDDYKLVIKMDGYRGEPAVNFAMINRAAGFRAANIGRPPELPLDIAGRFNKVADAAVGRMEPNAFRDLLDPSLDRASLGRLAAVLLKRDFHIVRYQPDAVDPNVAAILAEYCPSETSNDSQKAVFRFRRATKDAPWLFAGIEVGPR